MHLTFPFLVCTFVFTYAALKNRLMERNTLNTIGAVSKVFESIMNPLELKGITISGSPNINSNMEASIDNLTVSDIKLYGLNNYTIVFLHQPLIPPQIQIGLEWTNVSGTAQYMVAFDVIDNVRIAGSGFIKFTVPHAWINVTLDLSVTPLLRITSVNITYGLTDDVQVECRKQIGDFNERIGAQASWAINSFLRNDNDWITSALNNWTWHYLEENVNPAIERMQFGQFLRPDALVEESQMAKHNLELLRDEMIPLIV